MRPANVIFTETQKQEIKQRAEQGERLYNLAREYKVARYRITEVINGMTYREKMMNLPSADERKESDIRLQLARLKRYWNTFSVGDAVRLKYPLGKKCLNLDGTVTYKNRYFLNVKSQGDIFEVKMSDLILEGNKTQIKHIRNDERMG
jgi:hypothetical protein